MDRRRFLGALGGALAGATAGCLAGGGADPAARIALLELENHRRDEAFEFAVRIAADEVVFERTRRLGPAGSGTEAVAFVDPVDPGSYAVRVRAGGHSATVATEDLVSADEPCLGLQFYLGEETLHAEHRSYDRCE